MQTITEQMFDAVKVGKQPIVPSTVVYGGGADGTSAQSGLVTALIAGILPAIRELKVSN